MGANSKFINFPHMSSSLSMLAKYSPRSGDFTEFTEIARGREASAPIVFGASD